MQRTQAPGNLAWLDIEMTGLNPETDVILQVALIVTDVNLAVREEYVCDVWQPSSALTAMVPFVRQMHERTGLLDRVARSTTDLWAAEKQLLERIAAWCPYPAVLCGNSIAQDRRFLDRQMRGLAGYLHYRMIDVTTLKLLAGYWYGAEAIFAKPDAGEHDALVDIRNSIAELAHYRRHLLRP